ncbi:Por secretion system C-terminal sorting domain-containing protein [Flaviramulus basaltis]|uniref:Por secretion system C-terminal sorting domain-containing protein n=1 Tax=Flaviramulus basaltis TaxID=369401 RepID=A0A1K2IK89_9FLAO|nr:ThuA domain-containing protein [Flaviramulus basaltis]SFZ92799.1 Por secretion system C-terminal sorting domain-containing protein [Flaviramulus basaltis]
MYSEFRFFKKNIFIFFLVFNFIGFSQSKKILVYHQTESYRHPSIDAGIKMFEELGAQNNNWSTDNSQNSNVFTESNLAQYDAVVFLNTSGDDLLSNSEKIALEKFIANSKGFVGIHGASDTYRDKTWSFYNELVGAIIQSDPNHTSNNFNADMEVKTNSSITNFLGSVGSTWNKNEEYYYWELNGGQISEDNTVLLEVESTGNNSYDVARATTWYKESITYDDDNNSSTVDVTLSGIKSFYTSLGHNDSDYDSNTKFRTMLKNAVLWAIGETTLSVTNEKQFSEFKIIKNPVKNKVRIFFNNLNEDVDLKVYDITGKQIFKTLIRSSAIRNNLYELSVSGYRNGLYFFMVSTQNTTESFKVLKI